MRSLSQLRRAAALEVLRIDAAGLLVAGTRDQLVDVAFDGRRIWSFWLLRDGEQGDDGVTLTWPKPLRPFLDGVTEVTLSDPGTGGCCSRAPCSSGSVRTGSRWSTPPAVR